MSRLRIAIALSGMLLVLAAVACRENGSPLSGTSWALVTLDGESAVPGTTPWLRFDEDGLFSGSTGCNSVGGRWSGNGSKLSFREVATTLIGCPGPVGEQEAAFGAALAETAAFAIDGELLTLHDGAATPRMTFKPPGRGTVTP